MAESRLGITGSKSDIDTTPARLSSDTTKVVNNGIQLLADSTNTDVIYVGYNDTMTAGTADATDGFPIVAGAAIFLPCRHLSDIYLMSTTNPDQIIHFLGQ